jgi:Nuclear transport factor 2 (NTF2) domain
MIENATIAQYFQALNDGEFGDVGELFALDGVLCPPFHSEITGKDAIVSYLQQEAEGLCISPTHYSFQPLDAGEIEHIVMGKVQTSLLSVNASWQIVLDKDSKIRLVRIKLLASLADLLKVRTQKEG